MRPKLFTPGKVGSWEFLAVHCCVGVRFMVRICLSLFYSFLIAFPPFTWCVGVTQLVFGFFLEITVSCIAVDSVCSWEEESSGTFYVELEPTVKFWKPSSWSHFNISEEENYSLKNMSFWLSTQSLYCWSFLEPMYMILYKWWTWSLGSCRRALVGLSLHLHSEYKTSDTK